MSATVVWTRGTSVNAHWAQWLQAIEGRTAAPCAGFSPPSLGMTQQKKDATHKRDLANAGI